MAEYEKKVREVLKKHGAILSDMVKVITISGIVRLLILMLLWMERLSPVLRQMQL